ncbi:aminoacyl-tRNA hydrolase [Candidatus Persebacteraceae bacterium Df01]|jgi:PTH1 family peptidyl-tRNA hydrolase|uniref:Peptidyl-tRNA hydrolase n=1 Tax=Candidatus Doriopsillibacter californiensis TaxID=2970740 RepID=A0ABT7QMY9_9GAMM|nr:aminoacyl-tRNA hydrolase [Candidatus Persebacteraceae bacterium Df01]
MHFSPALVVGLGNPGAQYAATRHNAGFWFMHMLADGAPFSVKSSLHGDLAVTAGCRLLRPATFMNHSGCATAAVANYFKIPPAAILVVHDEVALPAGTARLKFGGGHAGHNGLADISKALDSRDYWRLRLGVGAPPVGDTLADYVLRCPPAVEREAVDAAIDRVLSIWPSIAVGDYENAMLWLHTQEK